MVNKLTEAFNEWQVKREYPEYLKTANIVPLSKEDNEYPDYSNIRVIAILPAVSKIFEKCILTRLDLSIQNNGGLHPN